MKLIIISILFLARAASAQVGIGTTNPNSNSVLDLTSPNKGLLLPRVASTSAVSSPTAGLMIYNMNTQSPAFYNGTVWNSLASALSGTTGDSITYTIFGPGNPLFVAGNYKVTSISFGGSNPGVTVNSTNIQDVFFTKNKDINSIGYKDWTNNLSFSFNLSTKVIGTY